MKYVFIALFIAFNMVPRWIRKRTFSAKGDLRLSLETASALPSSEQVHISADGAVRIGLFERNYYKYYYYYHK